MPACTGRYFLSGMAGDTETSDGVPAGTTGGVVVFKAGAQPLNNVVNANIKGARNRMSLICM